MPQNIFAPAVDFHNRRKSNNIFSPFLNELSRNLVLSGLAGLRRQSLQREPLPAVALAPLKAFQILALPTLDSNLGLRVPVDLQRTADGAGVAGVVEAVLVKDENVLVAVRGVLVERERAVLVLVPLALNLALVPDKIVDESKTCLLKDFYKIRSERQPPPTPDRFCR